MKSITIVTGLWNLDCDVPEDSYDTHKQKFATLLKCPNNMCIYIDPSDEEFIWKYRNQTNTKIFHRKLDDFKSWFEFYPLVQQIRQNISWYNQTESLSKSKQAQIEMYNPIMMSKMFLLHDIKIFNPFDSTYFFWTDPDIVEPKVPTICADSRVCWTRESPDITHETVFNNLASYVNSVNKFVILSYPYQNSSTEVDGFNRTELAKYCDVDVVKYVCSGKIFGGTDTSITEINNLYYHYLKQTLNDNLMGTEECIFTIIAHKHPELISGFDFDKISEALFTTTITKPFSAITTNLYVLTYNSPEQFAYLLNSFENSDSDFLNKPRKIVLNNSTDETTFEAYDTLCEKYGFEQIKKGNLGICRGRQFVADHFDQSDADYYIFFEDDMLLHEIQVSGNKFCLNGFRKWVPNLYDRTLKIMHKEKYDFLKLNFTEVYGGNEIQWAWYNVTDDIRHKYFPDKPNKPKIGFDPNPPLTQFTNIKRSEDLTYIEGEIYYCNWPMWFNKEGNRKVFLEPRFAYPYEQTWMSLVFQKHKEKHLLKVAVLLLSPINHDRIHYYNSSERREN